MKAMTRSKPLFFILFLLMLGVAASGCADSAFTAQAELEQDNAFSAQQDQSKFRHAHLLDRAVRTSNLGKGASSTNVGLIIKTNGIVQRHGIIFGYRT